MTLIERLRTPSSVRSWQEADAQRAEAANRIERLATLLTRAYGWLEDYECRSDEGRQAHRTLLSDINAALTEQGPKP